MNDPNSTLTGRLFPPRLDNNYTGRRAALWLIGLYIALKFAMSLGSIFNTATVAANADGIPLASFSPGAAREVMLLFSLTGLGQLTLAFVAAVALVRWRSMVPFVTAVLLGEAIARRAIVASYATERTADYSAGFAINVGLLALLVLALALSLLPRPGARPRAIGEDRDVSA